MTRRIISLTILLTLTCLFTACSSGKSLVARRVDLIDKDVQDVRSLQAEHTTEVAALRKEINMLRGTIEEMQYKNQARASADFNSPEQPELPGAERHSHNIVSPPPAIVPHEYVKRDLQLAETLPGVNGDMLKGSIEEASYGKFTNASLKLEELRDLSYGADWGAVVLFWLGISAEGNLNNKKAISYYHELVTSYPKHERTSVAMLRQGSVLIRERDSDTAKLIFEKLINDFPNSGAAEKAKQRLRDL